MVSAGRPPAAPATSRRSANYAVELRIAPNLFVFRKANCDLCEMQDLEEIIEKLLEVARKLPPGARRHGVLKEIGLFRMRMDALSVQSGKLRSAK